MNTGENYKAAEMALQKRTKPVFLLSIINNANSMLWITPFIRAWGDLEEPRGSIKRTNVKKKSAIYLYNYAKNFTPLHMVEKKYIHTMPKFKAICSFHYQSLSNGQKSINRHHVIHKNWGIYFCRLACILLTSENLHFLRKFPSRLQTERVENRPARSNFPYTLEQETHLLFQGIHHRLIKSILSFKKNRLPYFLTFSDFFVNHMLCDILRLPRSPHAFSNQPLL